MSANARITINLTSEVPRRGSPFVRPASPSFREPTPRPLTYEDLARRPRSNPRTRTPMRYESPLDPDAFRRTEPSPERREGQRVTVRPLAGTAVGTTLTGRRIRDVREERQVTPLSSKQGPSHRKVRRWNNDNFVGVASEIAKASSRGPAIAEAMLQAQADAPLYLSVYNPRDCPPSTMTRFMEQDDMNSLREEFAQGYIGDSTPRANRKFPATEAELTPQIMLNRIHGRLRSVTARACSTSQRCANVVDGYEKFLLMCFSKDKLCLLDPDASESLLEPPTVTRKKSGSTIAKFYFNSTSSAGGLHRLLLHAVCQFHGLQAVSKTIEIETHCKTSARLLSVTGSLSGPVARLSEHIGGRQRDNCSNDSERQ